MNILYNNAAENFAKQCSRLTRTEIDALFDRMDSFTRFAVAYLYGGEQGMAGRHRETYHALGTKLNIPALQSY